MKRIFVALFALSPLWSLAQWHYPTYEEVQTKINRLKSNKLVASEPIGQSFGKENIPILKIQKDDKVRPTLLVVGGIDGKHPAGVINSLDLAQGLLDLSADSLARILDKRSIWIVPMANPDAYKRNSKQLAWSSGNARMIDNDRDGRVDEDPAKDLNGGGVLSQLRIKSVSGTHRLHPIYSQVLQKVDTKAGERGNYRVLPEGIDTDFDGLFGEDGAGGVNIDRNFTFDYPAFYPESGAYAASEPETQALMDLVYDNPQILVIFQFGLANNLSSPEVYDAAKANDRIVRSWTANDIHTAKYISSLYKETTKGLGEAPKIPHQPGNFANTGYYHLGKFSFVSPGWWPSVADSTIGTKPTEADDIFYTWVTQNDVKGAVLPWTKIKHPNFPNEEVEVGGVVEWFKNNPPRSFLNAFTPKHLDFVQQVLHSMPELIFQTPVVTDLGGDIHRVELAITNIGQMPIYPEIADRIRHAAKFKAVCELQKNQEFLNGKRLQLYPSLAAGQTQTLSWLIKGKGTATITAGCPTTGDVKIAVKL